MKLESPSVGPIVGATSSSSVRIFLRGEIVLVGGRPKPAHAVLHIREAGTHEYQPPRRLPLNPNFDMTAVIVLEGLKANVVYEYQAGWHYDDATVKEPPIAWGNDTPLTFKTASDDSQRERTFAFGSCRYMLQLFGGSFFDDRGDKTFRAVNNSMKKDGPLDAFLMIGDQIYADDAWKFAPADRTHDAFLARYREAFSTKHLQELMARVPTYMTLDDHEIEDNWPKHATLSDYRDKYAAALHAYQVYQASHSPLLDVEEGKLAGIPEHFWYEFHDGCAAFFVTDTRTERTLDSKNPQIVSTKQLDALKKWLVKERDRVQFIATAVPFFGAKGDDKWGGFVQQRDEILEHIRTNQLRRVVFLSGDVHASFTTELVADGDKAFRVLQVVSSAFHWPVPLNLPGSTFPSEGLIESRTRVGYRIARRTDKIHREDNFTRVKCSLGGLKVDVISRKDKPLGESRHEF